MDENLRMKKYETVSSNDLNAVKNCVGRCWARNCSNGLLVQVRLQDLILKVSCTKDPALDWLRSGSVVWIPSYEKHYLSYIWRIDCGKGSELCKINARRTGKGMNKVLLEPQHLKRIEPMLQEFIPEGRAWCFSFIMMKFRILSWFKSSHIM